MIKPIAYEVTRDVTPDECRWLEDTIQKGTIVYEFMGHTFGCCSPSGEPVTLDEKGDYPFFELPKTALKLKGN